MLFIYVRATATGIDAHKVLAAKGFWLMASELAIIVKTFISAGGANSSVFVIVIRH